MALEATDDTRGLSTTFENVASTIEATRFEGIVVLRSRTRHLESRQELVAIDRPNNANRHALLFLKSSLSIVSPATSKAEKGISIHFQSSSYRNLP